jgi:hypothetical protein
MIHGVDTGAERIVRSSFAMGRKDLVDPALNDIVEVHAIVVSFFQFAIVSQSLRTYKRHSRLSANRAIYYRGREASTSSSSRPSANRASIPPWIGAVLVQTQWIIVPSMLEENGWRASNSRPPANRASILLIAARNASVRDASRNLQTIAHWFYLIALSMLLWPAHSRLSANRASISPRPFSVRGALATVSRSRISVYPFRDAFWLSVVIASLAIVSQSRINPRFFFDVGSSISASRLSANRASIPISARGLLATASQSRMLVVQQMATTRDCQPIAHWFHSRHQLPFEDE